MQTEIQDSQDYTERPCLGCGGDQKIKRTIGRGEAETGRSLRVRPVWTGLHREDPLSKKKENCKANYLTV